MPFAQSRPCGKDMIINMKRVFTVICAVLAAAFMCVPVHAAKLPDCNVSLIASHITAVAGDEIQVSLVFNNASEYPYGLGAFCAKLTYNSNAVKLKSVKSAAPRSDVTSNNSGSTLNTLYVFASVTAQPGFNTDGVFYTATFKVLENASGNADFALTFDEMTVCEYSSDGKVTNHKVPFNSPSASVAIKSGSLNSESSQTASSQASSAAPVNSQSASSQPADSGAPVQSQADPSGSVKNDSFVSVEDSGADKIAVDVFDDSGNIISADEEYPDTSAVTSGTASSGADETVSAPSKDADEKSGMPLGVVIAVAGSVITVAAVVVIIIISSKKANKNQNKKG
jgi:hypothetical protein